MRHQCIFDTIVAMLTVLEVGQVLHVICLFSFLKTQIHLKQSSQCMCFFLIQANRDAETGSAPPVLFFRSDFNSHSAGTHMRLNMYLCSFHLPPAANLMTSTTLTPNCDRDMRSPRHCDVQVQLLYAHHPFLPKHCYAKRAF